MVPDQSHTPVGHCKLQVFMLLQLSLTHISCKATSMTLQNRSAFFATAMLCTGSGREQGEQLEAAVGELLDQACSAPASAGPLHGASARSTRARSGAARQS